MNKYQEFIYENFSFDEANRELTLSYSFDNILNFNEIYKFDFEYIKDVEKDTLNRAFQMLFIMAGISYYKAYIPKTIRINKGAIDKKTSSFFNKTFQKGLGEFFYVNKLDPKTEINFPNKVISNTQPESSHEESLLIGIGGGKDSLVSVEILRNQPKVATWSLNHKAQLKPLIERIGLKHFWVERTIDSKILEINKQDALNGHIPISAIFACVGTIVSLLTGYSQAVVSNENSANEPTLTYQGIDINHQYSKSLEFEIDYQNILKHIYNNKTQYFSFLRPLSEVYISRLFAEIGLDKYQDVFSSCNRAYVQTSNNLSWCGECSKCAFTFLALTPFVDKSKLENIWGKNLLLDPDLKATYDNLLGISGDKPLDCVGEIKESREAMFLSQKVYPQLSEVYRFELPSDYSYESLSKHSMPAKYFERLKSYIN